MSDIKNKKDLTEEDILYFEYMKIRKSNNKILTKAIKYWLEVNKDYNHYEYDNYDLDSIEWKLISFEIKEQGVKVKYSIYAPSTELDLECYETNIINLSALTLFQCEIQVYTVDEVDEEDLDGIYGRNDKVNYKELIEFMKNPDLNTELLKYHEDKEKLEDIIQSNENKLIQINRKIFDINTKRFKNKQDSNSKKNGQ